MIAIDTKNLAWPMQIKGGVVPGGAPRPCFRPGFYFSLFPSVLLPHQEQRKTNRNPKWDSAVNAG